MKRLTIAQHKRPNETVLTLQYLTTKEIQIRMYTLSPKRTAKKNGWKIQLCKLSIDQTITFMLFKIGSKKFHRRTIYSSVREAVLFSFGSGKKIRRKSIVKNPI